MFPTNLRSYSSIDTRFSPNVCIEKHIERHQLQKILANWTSTRLEDELKAEASIAILDFYDRETNLEYGNQPKELKLSNYRLRSLPNIFSILPFKGLVKLDLSWNHLKELPPMDKLQDLQYITINTNSFKRFPNTLCRCQNLRHLDLGQNKLTEIPNEINELRSLQTLDLYRNRLKELPNLCSLSNLQSLNCSSNKLSRLLSSFKNLKSLVSLNLSDNEFKECPSSILHLQNLKELLLYENQLRELPNLSLLQKLNTINLSYNFVSKFPEEICELPELTHLFAKNNDFLSFPSKLENLTNLIAIKLSFEKSCQIPTDITLPSTLTTLAISKSSLTDIPEFITNCSSLTDLQIEESEITTIPDRITHLTRLEKLDLSYNQLHSLPSCFSELKKLKELDLSINRFTEFPKVLLDLRSLTYLNFDDNNLRELPSLSQLDNLEALSMCANQLTSLPDHLSNLPSSLTMILDDNPFTVEEVERIQDMVDSENYNGPDIIGLSIHEHLEENLPGQNITEICNLLFEFSERTPKEFVHLPNDSLTLLSWLQRLGRVAEFKTETNKKLISTKILDILETANENQVFRELFFTVIEEASRTCGDRVGLSILHLDIRQQLETADLTNSQEISSLLLRGIFAMNLLESQAREKINTRKASDDIETYLAYPIQLKEDLNLPFAQTNMRYFQCSGVTPTDLQEAKDMVLSHLQNEQKCISFLIEEAVWHKVLALNYPKEWKRIESNKNLGLEEDEPDYNNIQNKFQEELKVLTQKVVYHPETIGEQSLEDFLEILLNCLEKSKFNARLATEHLVSQRENLLTAIFVNSETKEQTLDKLGILLSTLYFFYQQAQLKDAELSLFLLPVSGSTNVPSISSCVKEILSKNFRYFYVELFHKLSEREEIFESFSIKEKNLLHRHAKSVNLLTQLITFTKARIQSLTEQSTDTQSVVTLSLFSLLKHIKNLFEDKNRPSPLKRRKVSQDIELLLSQFEKLTQIILPSIPLLHTEEICFSREEAMRLITNYKEYEDTQKRLQSLCRTNVSAEEKYLSSKSHSLHEKLKNVYTQKVKKAQTNTADTTSIVASTWLSGVSRSAPTPSLSLPLFLQNSASATHNFSTPSTSSAIATTSNSRGSSSSIDPTEAALSRLSIIPDTQLRGSGRTSATRTAMMDPIYYKKV